MNSIGFLEKQFGGRWCGINFDYDENSADNGKQSRQTTSFCAAAAKPHHWPSVLTGETVDCPGCSFSFGWRDDWEPLTANITKFLGLSEKKVESILQEAPVLHKKCSRVVVGIEDDPDVLISFAQPETVMKIILQWQRMYGWQVVVETSSFMSVCGTVAVRAFETDKVCISFGCPKSRSYTKIGRDRMVVGLNRRLAEAFSNSEHKFDYIETN